MSEQTFEEFRELVLSDAPLQGRLRDIADRDEFVTVIVKTAGEIGMVVTPEDIKQAMHAGRRAWIERWI